MTNIFVLPLTQKAPFTKGSLLAVNGYLLATFNISDSGQGTDFEKFRAL